MVMKGYVKTLEAGIAIVLILASIIFLFPEQTKKEPQIPDTGYDCLRYLDQKGLLSYYAENNLELELNSELRECIPPILEYKAKICTITDCDAILPTYKTIFLSSYLIAGESSFNPTLINLWIWST
jgi:hypothetical protein